MGTTSPDNITFPDAASPGAFRVLMAAMATSIQNALKNRISKGGYRYATVALRDVDWPSGSTPTGTRARVDTELFEREWNGTSWLPAGAGLLPIKPSGTVGSGISLTGGAVSFSGASQVQVNDCFPGGFDGYRIIIQSNMTANDYLRMFVHNAGVTVANNDAQITRTSGTTVTPEQNMNTPSLRLGGNISGPSSTVLDLIPFPSNNVMLATGQTVDALGGVSSYELACRFEGMATGLTIQPGSGTTTGRIEVYGYRQNTL